MDVTTIVLWPHSIELEANMKTAVVFVHGFIGGVDTWRNSSGDDVTTPRVTQAENVR